MSRRLRLQRRAEPWAKRHRARRRKARSVLRTPSPPPPRLSRAAICVGLRKRQQIAIFPCLLRLHFRSPRFREMPACPNTNVISELHLRRESCAILRLLLAFSRSEDLRGSLLDRRRLRRRLRSVRSCLPPRRRPFRLSIQEPTKISTTTTYTRKQSATEVEACSNSDRSRLRRLAL